MQGWLMTLLSLAVLLFIWGVARQMFRSLMWLRRLVVERQGRGVFLRSIFGRG